MRDVMSRNGVVMTLFRIQRTPMTDKMAAMTPPMVRNIRT